MTARALAQSLTVVYGARAPARIGEAALIPGLSERHLRDGGAGRVHARCARGGAGLPVTGRIPNDNPAAPTPWSPLVGTGGLPANKFIVIKRNHGEPSQLPH